MANNITIQRIVSQYKKFISEPHEYIKVAMSENPFVWYVLVSNFEGNDKEYSYVSNGVTHFGEYIFEIQLPDDYPYNPPRFYAKTPNGLYAVDGKCCISVGEYHNNSYRTVLGVMGFVMELVNGFIGWQDLGHGINLNTGKSSIVEKKKFAVESIGYNEKHHKDILLLVLNNYENYSKEWVKK